MDWFSYYGFSFTLYYCLSPYCGTWVPFYAEVILFRKYMRYGGGLTLLYIHEVAYFVSPGPIEWRKHSFCNTRGIS
jgi:hypothetical protein